jgi:hypothetical protein
MTRNVNSAKALKLRNRGVEVISGRMQNPNDVRRLFTGTYGVFAMTAFWGKILLFCS